MHPLYISLVGKLNSSFDSGSTDTVQTTGITVEELSDLKRGGCEQGRVEATMCFRPNSKLLDEGENLEFGS